MRAETGDLADPVARARLVLRLMATGGPAIGGLWLRSRPSPAREAFLAVLDGMLPETARIGPETDDIALSGGVDVGASLAAGRRVLRAGLLNRPGRLTLTSAERAPPALSARLALALDRGDAVLVALDEGADDEEAMAPVLRARTSLFVNLDGLDRAAADRISAPFEPHVDDACLAGKVPFSAGLETILAEYARSLGVADLRHDLAARAVARGLAALRRAKSVEREDIDAAAALVLAPRAERQTEQPEVDKLERPEEGRDRSEPSPAEGEAGEQDLIAGPVTVRLPGALLAPSAKAPSRGNRGDGAGTARRGTTRGRPLPSRPGHPSMRARIDPVATLRAAIPFQRLRPPAPGGQPVALRPADIRIRRYEERSDRVIIFAVDASGSQAMARMAEAKGAVECLLGEAYRRRDQVALVAFRGRGAEILLPPTNALVRARNALVGLPAGGATPLASGLDAAARLADQARAGGATPVIVLLSDGRANIARDGRADRRRAAEDAETAARGLATAGVECLVLDTGRRPEAPLERLARALGGRYVAMPFAGAREMSTAVAAALDV
ncbi:MAG: VWA domain-containing protein [Paracoccaceae bacterium]|nr:VWA domain-containing protein [Paracoccaceae bacterium]